MIIIENKIILSTASFCLWDISIYEKLEYARDLGFKKVQIAISTIKMLSDFCTKLDNLSQLEYFDEVSLHAPWCGLKYGNNKKTRNVLEYLNHIDSILDIDRYVFNYDSIIDIGFLKDFNQKVVIRNPVVPKSWYGFKYKIEDKNIPCAFDINKACRSENTVSSMIDQVKKSICQVHISGFINGKNRMPVVSTNQSHLLDYLDKFDIEHIPLVIEGLFSPEDLFSIDSERELIESYYHKCNV